MDDAPIGFKLIKVSAEVLPDFEKWVADRANSWATCPEWPTDFTCRRESDDPRSAVVIFRVESPAWPRGSADLDWTPSFFSRGPGPVPA